MSTVQFLVCPSLCQSDLKDVRIDRELQERTFKLWILNNCFFFFFFKIAVILQCENLHICRV